jgi:hypothetical protein
MLKHIQSDPKRCIHKVNIPYYNGMDILGHPVYLYIGHVHNNTVHSEVEVLPRRNNTSRKG